MLRHGSTATWGILLEVGWFKFLEKIHCAYFLVEVSTAKYKIAQQKDKISKEKRKNYRSRQDSNLRGQSPMDF